MIDEYLAMRDLNDEQKLIFTSEFREVKKDPNMAILITLFLGGLGGHKFYIGKIGQGVVYLLFFWTFIPSLIALFDLLFISDKVRSLNAIKAVELATRIKTILPGTVTKAS